MDNLKRKNEKGSIALFVLVSALFFLVIVGSVSISARNRLAATDIEYQKIKSSYEKDVGNEEAVYSGETEVNGKLELQKVGNKRVKFVLTNSKQWGSEYNYKIYVKDVENQNARVLKEGSTTENTITTDEVETFFDVGIQDSYAEIEFKGRTVTSNHCTYEDMMINKVAELKSFATKVTGGKSYEGKVITQIADLDLQGSSSNQWATIGTETNPFKGTYDGGNHTINNIYINNSSQNQALFGGNSGSIKDLSLTGSITSTKVNIGGFVSVNNGIIKNCTNNATITGEATVGGIVGYNIR